MGTMLKLEMKGVLREIMKFDADYRVIIVLATL